MFQKINIYDNDWVDLLFQTRNQSYGAYQLRKDTSKRHVWGIVAALIFFSMLIWLPILYKQITPKRVERNVEVTVLSDIQIEQKKPEEPQNIYMEKPPAPPLKSTIKFTPPVVKLDEEVLDEDLMKTQDELLETELTISIADIKGTDEEHGVDIADLNVQIVDEGTQADEPFSIVEQMPEFPGGEAALRKFLSNSVKYPVIAQENGIQGKVFVAFVVERDGSISNVKVTRGVDASLDKEAVRVVQNMPKWLPGKQNGEPVRVSFTVPISFVLQ